MHIGGGERSGIFKRLEILLHMKILPASYNGLFRILGTTIF